MTESTGASDPNRPDDSTGSSAAGSPPPAASFGGEQPGGAFGAPPDLSKRPETHVDPAAQAYGAPPPQAGEQHSGQPFGSAPQHGSAPQPGSAPPYGSAPQYGAYPGSPQPYGAMPAPSQGYGYGQYAPSAVPGFYVDPEAGIDIPNGTTLASPGRRVGAYFLAVPLIIVTLVIGYIVWGLIAWNKGTSPALQVLGMKVYKPQERQVASFGTMALRNIVGGIVEGISIIGLISFIMFLTDKQRRALHDRIGSTTVLHDPNKVLEPPATA